MKRSLYIRSVLLSVILLAIGVFVYTTHVTPLSGGNNLPRGENHIPNPNLEEASASGIRPLGWDSNSWGQNKPTFTYVLGEEGEGYALRVEIADHREGDAKWWWDPMPLESGHYHFSLRFRTNTEPHAVARFEHRDGRIEFVGLTRPIPNQGGTWQSYSSEFFVPEGLKSVTAFMFIQGDGWLETDTYALVKHEPAGFKRPLLTLTFDDGHEHNTATALPLLKELGIVTTQCYATTFIEGVEGAAENVAAFRDAGHEICSHTVTHPFLSEVDKNTLTYELEHSKNVLSQLFGEEVTTFASPFGDYNADVLDAVQKFYDAHRSVEQGFNSMDNFDPYRLRVQNILAETTLEEVQAWVEKAKEDSTWLILVYHKIDHENIGAFDLHVKEFERHMRWLAEAEIAILTYRDALKEVKEQLSSANESWFSF